MPDDKENDIFIELLNKQRKDIKNNKLEYNGYLTPLYKFKSSLGILLFL